MDDLYEILVKEIKCNISPEKIEYLTILQKLLETVVNYLTRTK